MKILAIETSCDDTSVAIVEVKVEGQPRFNVLSSIVSSQILVHKKWGGVVPNLAKREHQKNLVPVLTRVLKETKLLKKTKEKKSFSAEENNLLAKLFEREEILLKNAEKFLKEYEKPEVDLVAVTIGPGLEPSLWVGVNFAKALASFWKIPVVAVNHLEAHVLANWLGKNQTFPMAKPSRISRWNRESSTSSGLDGIGTSIKNEIFPAICLIVSGGHTQLVLVQDFGKYKTIGETRDDAAGECFDKAARILGLGYPGGPAIAAEAAKFKIQNSRLRQGHSTLRVSDSMSSGGQAKFKIELPRPMIRHKNYDFSFSGLKTAVLYDFKERSAKVSKSRSYIREMCKEVQQAIIDVLTDKIIRAGREHRVRMVMLGGGVSANKELRKQMEDRIKREMPSVLFSLPDLKYCTDNAAMVAVAAFHTPKEARQTKIEVDGNLRIG